MFTERRSGARHKVHGPVFASFDGVTGGMILDLSDQGLSMQTAVPLERNQRLQLRLDLPKNESSKSNQSDAFETSAYVAWADALGRAGVRFSELPAEARQRIDQWLALNDQATSRKAPKLSFDPSPNRIALRDAFETGPPCSISLEPAGVADESEGETPASTTMQYEFHSLGPDLDDALRTISERARKLLRGSGAAIALIDKAPPDPHCEPSHHMVCRASAGNGGPLLGSRVDVNSGFSGECIRTGQALYCADAETDERVEAEACRSLGIRSIAAAPIRYEREVVGLIEVFSTHAFAFDEGDLAVLERLVQTLLLLLSQHLQGASTVSRRQ
jgi:hypothetical protein